VTARAAPKPHSGDRAHVPADDTPARAKATIARLTLQILGWLGALGAILATAAGDWRWPQAGFLLAELGIGSLAVGLWLSRHDPDLLATRLSAPIQPGQPLWDRAFLAGFFASFFAWMALIGLDAQRFGWSHMPWPAQATGGALIALGMAAIWQTFRYNSFAAPQVRVQVERGHRVVTDGPYRLVRHPFYASALLLLFGMPLLLGSWWGLATVPLIGASLAWRAIGEEQLLRRALPEYDEYAARVRFRLIPGIW
jgi:protein-S-isoprenylcysteine O-methyltransferase Ste14